MEAEEVVDGVAEKENDGVDLAVDDSSEAAPKAKRDLSADGAGFANENDGLACSPAPNEKGGGAVVGVASTVVAGFFPKISITLPVSNVDTLLESGTAGDLPKLKMGLAFDADVVVVAAILKPDGP